MLKYTENGGKFLKKVLFICVDGELSAMLILSYKADMRKKKELKALEKNGVSLLINQRDPNVTKKLINNLFGINETYVSIITGDLSQAFENTVRAEVTRADALAATKGRVESLMKAVSASNEIKPVLSTLVVALLFAFFSPLNQISAFSIILFDIFCLVLLLIIPKIKLKIK